MKKSIAVVLLVVMLVGVFSSVALARYTYISRVDADLDISGGKATARITVSAFDASTIKTKIVLEQKPVSGGSWSECATWTNSQSNSTRFTTSGSTSVSSGYYYRVKATGTVSGENATATSGEIKY